MKFKFYSTTTFFSPALTNHAFSSLLFLAAILACVPLQAKVTVNEANQLGNSLTPMGAEKAGNADKTIPAWDGGISKPISGYQLGNHHPDPFPAEQPLFIIDSSNYTQYQDNLSAGQIELLKTYPSSFNIPVYKTHRSAAFPDEVYQATKQNALTAELIEQGNSVSGAILGIPFPIPKNGMEVIWNHLLRYRGVKMARWGGQAAPTASGNFTVIGFDEKIIFTYSQQNMTAEKLSSENILNYFKQQVTSPARLKGTALLVHETLNQVKQPRQAWTYNTGQRRVRKAPNIAYDAPGTASDGLRTTDDFDMFNGSPSYYDWNLVGKREVYIPYNAYQLHAKGVAYDDILHKGHLNPNLTRYEKHRVWVVEANLKSDKRHIYKKRVFYIDEDSWQIALVDAYDNRQQLYRVNMMHAVNYYEVPTLWTTMDVYHDLNSRRYLALGLDNNEKMYDFSVELKERDFTPQALRRSGLR